jgi:hypothetical protein
MELIFLLASWIGGDVDRLEAERWDHREAAQARLRSWGYLAVPQLLKGARGSESPEVRQRCHELLVPYQRMTAKLRAVAVLSGPRLPDQSAFFHDTKLRADVFRLAREAGCTDYGAWHLPFVFGKDHELTPAELMDRLTEYRKQLGYHRTLWDRMNESLAPAAVGLPQAAASERVRP